VDLIHLGQGRDKWQALVNTARKASDAIEDEKILDQLKD
jgi:hypothetical protein